MIDLNAGSSFIYGQPYTPPPPVRGIITDPGMGKTRQWRKKFAAPLVAQGLHPVLAVPRHRLGEEVVADFADEGIEAFCYRGRDADDPLAPGHKMCREQERIKSIGQALGEVSRHACRRGDKQCRYFDICGYQRQQRQRPQVSVCAHQMLFQERPAFIAQPDALGIDEKFWDAGMRGQDKLKPVKLWLFSLKEDRRVPRDDGGTADLVATSDRVNTMLLRENPGFLRRKALIDAGITVDELKAALQLEWRRKKGIGEVFPNMPLQRVQLICGLVAAHNQDVWCLATFWDLLIRTLESDNERSPYLYLNPNERTGLTGSNTRPAIRMVWRADIHHTWRAPTIVMDATMSPDIVRQFLPDMSEPVRIAASTAHTYVRQIIDRPMSAAMLIRSANNAKSNRTRENHVLDVMRFIETRANDVRPGRVLVVCQLDLEAELDDGSLQDNVQFAHFNGIAGVNAWNDVALLILIGRTEPPPREVEKLARALFDADVAEMPEHQWYPKVDRGVRMRDGGVAVIQSPAHPDRRAEAVRSQICEAELIQAIGRGRAVNRTAADPLQIDILTAYPLPIVVDELTTWELVQPTDAEVMRSRGAVPMNYRDMATAYSDLFTSPHAAQMRLIREFGIGIKGVNRNLSQSPIESYLIGVCDGFLSISFRRKGFRGPPSKLLFDPERIEPLAWLNERIGEVAIKGKARKQRSRSQGGRKRR